MQNSCPTLAHEGLAGVKEDVTAFCDHALNGQVFADVLRLTDFVMHDPVEIGSKRYAVPLSGSGDAGSLGRPTKRSSGEGPTVKKEKGIHIY